jgi:mannosyltransferase OCH1-like enzyme
MIPKIIHWIWFGDKNKIPDQFQQNLESWKRFFPDYEIKCWDESNYDVNKNLFTKEQYEQGNYAFVSDFARLDIVYQYGGMYFDIDVEVIKPFDDLPEQFFGFEAYYRTKNTLNYGINPGSGFRCKKGHPLFFKMLQTFDTKEAITKWSIWDEKKEQMIRTTTSEPTRTLFQNKFILNNKYQIKCAIHLLPYKFLSPFISHCYNHNKDTITPETVSIHHYTQTWINDNLLKRR